MVASSLDVSKAIHLHNLWSSEIANAAANPNGARLEVMSWLNKMTLDVIGLAGKLNFSYYRVF
ncbi:hypothetical protein BDN67DRAFT_1014555 [Paxillus ammoniavirescens]|nr:hypothetical protein BDN67DRAFT_1014555 [Paxillus ammoniavirescens]